uniref:Uncharacterized protein n=1 Tax=Rhizophora mucronata TaxID=61149 RepID=A0A2P2Q6J9_RHIMU
MFTEEMQPNISPQSTYLSTSLIYYLETLKDLLACYIGGPTHSSNQYKAYINWRLKSIRGHPVANAVNQP